MSENLRELWVVMIEADGNQMPSWFYRRRDSFALRVRGDKELSPINRRTDEGKTPGVIFQEGVMICPSESQARGLATLALEAFEKIPDLVGHPCVRIGRVYLSADTFSSTMQDIAIMERVENVLGKRGRRPDSTDWSVTCLECMAISHVHYWSPVNCPECGGFRIHIRRGKVVAYSDPGGDIFEAWKRTRFAGPHWEPVPIRSSARRPPPTVDILDERERGVMALIEQSDVLDKIRQMPRDVAMGFLDAILTSRTYRSEASRLHDRVQLATEFFKRGGAPADYNLAEPPLPDLADAAIIGYEIVLKWMMANGERPTVVNAPEETVYQRSESAFAMIE